MGDGAVVPRIERVVVARARSRCLTMSSWFNFISNAERRLRSAAAR